MPSAPSSDAASTDALSTWTAEAAIDAHDGFLIDAFGVLVDHSGARDGARAFLKALNAANKSWLIVTNDAARTPATAATWYRSLGLPIPNEKVLTSSALLSTWVQNENLAGRPGIVLGPPDAVALVEEAGVIATLPPTATGKTRDGIEPEFLVICDEAGYPFLETLDAVTTWWIQMLDAGRAPPVVLANPDLIYPKGGGTFGIAAGSVATLLENAVRVRHPATKLNIAKLGKPFAPMFLEAFDRLGVGTDIPKEKTLMIGDTLATNIRGGNVANIRTAWVTDSDLVHTIAAEDRPTFRLRL